MSTDHVPTVPLHAIFDAAKHFGLTEDEVWDALNECFRGVDDSTVGDCLDELIVELARRILDAAAEPPR